MKILHISGIDSTIYYFRLELLNTLKECGVETHVAFKVDNKFSTEKIREGGHIVHEVNINRDKIDITNIWRSIRKIERIIKDNQFDIVHTHTPIGGLIGRIAASRARVPHVLHTTGGWYFNENMSRMKYFVFRMMESYLARKTDFIFSVNYEDIKIANKLGIRPKQKIVYSGPAGVDLNKFEVKSIPFFRSKLKNDLNVEPSYRLVGFVGRLVREKGLVEFIEAAKIIVDKIDRVKFVIVGQGPDEVYFKNRIRELGLSEHFKFLGWREDIPEIMMGLDLYMFPSAREGLPITVLEAMAALVPVVAFDIRGCREAIVDGQTGYLVPFPDAKALADASVKIFVDNKEEEFGENGRKRVTENYLKKHHVQRQMDVYTRILKEFGNCEI